MSSPKVSILLPAYNRADYLKEAIDSALGQTYRDFELVIVDDGSTDNTPAICKSIPDPRIRYYYQENRGVSAALNAAWRQSRGEYIALLGSDDAWLPNLLAELVPALDADQDLGLIYGRAKGMDEAGKPMPQVLGSAPKYPAALLPSLLYSNCVCALALVIRRECIESAGGFDERKVANEDWDLWIRMAPLCRCKYTNKILARYRLHKGNLSGPGSTEYESIILDRVHLIEGYFEQPVVPLEALAIKPFALRNVYMEASIRFLAIGRFESAFPFLVRAMRATDNPVTSGFRIAGVLIFDLYLSKSNWGTRLVNGIVDFRRARACGGPFSKF